MIDAVKDFSGLELTMHGRHNKCKLVYGV